MQTKTIWPTIFASLPEQAQATMVKNYLGSISATAPATRVRNTTTRQRTPATAVKSTTVARTRTRKSAGPVVLSATQHKVIAAVAAGANGTKQSDIKVAGLKANNVGRSLAKLQTMKYLRSAGPPGQRVWFRTEEAQRLAA